MSPTPARTSVALLLVFALAGASPRGLDAQAVPEARPASVELDATSDRTRILLAGEKVERFVKAMVVDRRGSPVKGVEARLGTPSREGLPLEIGTSGAEPGRYGLVLEDDRARVEVKLEVTVTATATPPRILDLGAPRRVEVGERLTLGVAATGERPLRYVEVDQGAGPRKMEVPGSREVKEELLLDAFAAPGMHRVTVRAVDEDGQRSEPASVEVEVLEPEPVPEIAGVTLNVTALGPSTEATLTVHLSVAVPDPVEVSLEVDLPATAPELTLPAAVAIPAGATEASVSFTTPGTFTGTWDARFGASLNGSQSMVDASLTGIPEVATLSAPDWVLSEDDFEMVATLSHPAPPGGTTVAFGVSNLSGGGPWTAPAPEGATQVSLTRSMERSLNASFPMTLTASTTVMDTPATAETELHPRPTPNALYLLGGSILISGGQGTVGLSRPAPPGGLDVALSFEPGGILSLPATVTVPEGADQATFEATVTSPPTDEIVQGVLRATALGASVENPYVKVYPPVPFLDSLWVPDILREAVYVPTSEIRFFYRLGAVPGDHAYAPLDIQVTGPATVTPEPGTATPTQPNGSLTLVVDDVQAEGDLEVTVSYGGGSVTETFPVARPRLIDVSFFEGATVEVVELTEATYPSNVRCTVTWAAGGIAAGDLPNDYLESVLLESDRPDLIDIRADAPLRHSQGSTSNTINATCNPLAPVPEPTPVTITATLNGESVSGQITILPTEAAIDDLWFNSSFNNELVFGQPFRLTLHTDAYASSQTATLTSSDPDFLALPAEVPLDAQQGNSTVVELTVPAPNSYAPPFPKNVTITAEAGGGSRSMVVAVRPATWLAGIARGSYLNAEPYPAEFVNVTFNVESLGYYPEEYALELSTDRAEVFSDFPTRWVAGESPPAVTLWLAEYAEGGPVTVTVTDGRITRDLTVTLAKPTLRGVTFDLLGATTSSGNVLARDGTDLSRLDAAELGDGIATATLKCLPDFDLRQPGAEWTEPVALSTDRPDLLDLPAQVDVTFRGLGSAGVTTTTGQCVADFSTLTEPTLVEVTATYGDQTATGTLELVPALPGAPPP